MTTMAAGPAPKSPMGSGQSDLSAESGSRGRLKTHAGLILKLAGFLLLWALLVGAPLGLLMPLLSKQLPEPALRLFGDGVIGLALVFATAVFARWVDRRPVSDFALTHRRLGRDLAAGAAIGLVMTAAVAAVLLATGEAKPGGLVVTSWRALAFAAFATLVNCFAQEFLLRGYLLMSMARTWGGTAAAVVTSVIFAAIHPQVWAGTPQALLLGADIFGAGLILGACVLMTRSIWLATGLHFAWNLAQPMVFGPDHIYWAFEGAKGGVVALPPGRILEADPASFAGLAVGAAIVVLWQMWRGPGSVRPARRVSCEKREASELGKA